MAETGAEVWAQYSHNHLSGIVHELLTAAQHRRIAVIRHPLHGETVDEQLQSWNDALNKTFLDAFCAADDDEANPDARCGLRQG